MGLASAGSRPRRGQNHADEIAAPRDAGEDLAAPAAEPIPALAGGRPARVAGRALGAEIIDRVVAVVGQQAITASEVETQLRLEAMFNREPLEHHGRKAPPGPATAHRRAADPERGHDGRISESQRSRSAAPPGASPSRNAISTASHSRTRSSSMTLREQDVTDFWRQVIGYERFKDFRFKTGLEVSREEVSAYYESAHRAGIQAEGNGSPPPLDDIYDKVEQAVIEERANALLDEWLKETRPQTRIVILKEERQTTPRASSAAGAATDGAGRPAHEARRRRARRAKPAKGAGPADAHHEKVFLQTRSQFAGDAGSASRCSPPSCWSSRSRRRCAPTGSRTRCATGWLPNWSAPPAAASRSGAFLFDPSRMTISITRLVVHGTERPWRPAAAAAFPRCASS